MEQWKSIPGYEGIYDASNLGRIRSTPGKTTANTQYSKRVWKSRVLKPKWENRKCGKRDARVDLWKDGKVRTMLVARLVAMAWCDGYKEGLTVNHLDGNTENNCSDNLEWTSTADNNRHAFECGLMKSIQTPVVLIDSDGEAHGFASMNQASRFLKRSNGYVSAAFGRDRGLVWSAETHEPYRIEKVE